MRNQFVVLLVVETDFGWSKNHVPPSDVYVFLRSIFFSIRVLTYDLNYFRKKSPCALHSRKRVHQKKHTECNVCLRLNPTYIAITDPVSVGSKPFFHDSSQHGTNPRLK